MKTVNPRWGRIQDLFNRAADMPLAERAGFLAQECGDDATLRTELEALLAADAGPPSDVQSGIRASLLTQAVSMAIDKTTRDRRSELIGTVVGAYRLTAVLGHGGAGTVYLGERSDRQYSAQVAVKVVENALMHEEVAKRFQAERQILANLNHPHIARLLDAGETRTGQPYLVMEYVHGDPIDKYCDSQRLELKGRLQLFIKVCAAVQYAHQNLIVHRDLKPGNILVTPDGTPKLLDFGIAKLMDASAKAAAELALTRVNDRVLTPEYASPEQILGQNVTTTSDVYALGIVLYELLTGTRPYQVNAVSQLELERSICIMDPARPSQMVDKLSGEQAAVNPLDVKAIAAARSLNPRKLKHELTGDLDAIVMRALRKEPERRYSSVEQLVDDIKRHLDQQPVLATQGNWLYYSTRFVHRHAVGVGMTTAAAVALIAFSIIMSIQAKRIAEQRDLAEQESARAESVSGFMLEVFTAADPFKSQGKEVTAKDLLDNAGQRIVGDLNQQPEVRARLLEAIGRSYQRQGQTESAIKYLKDALLLHRKYHPDNGETIAKALGYLGVAHRDRAEYDEARQAFDEAAELLQRTGLKQSTTYLQILSDSGRLELHRSNPLNAAKHLQESLALARQLHGNAHPETAAILISLAQAFLWQGKTDQATQAAREAVSIYHSTLSEKHPDRVMADYALGEMLFLQGKFDEAAKLVSSALDSQKLLFGERNINVAGTLDTLARIYENQERWELAETTAKEALEITTSVLGDRNIGTAYYHSALADLLTKRKKYIEAEKSARTAVTILQSTASTDNQYLASAEYLLAEILVATRRSKEAEPLLRANIDRWRRADAPAWRIARSTNLLGEALLLLNRRPDGANLLRDSYQALSAADSGAPADVVATAKNRLANAGL